MFQATSEDAHKYLQQLRQFASTSRAQAALLAGGLFSRLVSLFVDVSTVLVGPSQDATWLHVGLRLQCFNVGMVGDELTNQEKDFLCGTYQRASKSNIGMSAYSDVLPCLTPILGHSHDALLSWWPWESAWSACHLHLGQWTPAAEEWFYHCMQQIVDGTASCMAGKQWKYFLRGAHLPSHAKSQSSYNKVNKLRIALEVVCKQEMKKQGF